MNNSFVLKLLDFLQPFFNKLNIDYPLMRSMLAVKLLMDERRLPAIYGETTKQKGNPFLNSLWIYSLYGLILVYFVFGQAYMLQMSIVFAVALFILMTTFIADFSSVLLDTRDKAITAAKPVDQRTIAAVKYIHILMYFILLTGALSIIPILFMLFIHGIIFTLLFIIMLVFLMFFSISATALVYVLVLQFFDGEKLKRMINYTQIVFAVGIIIGYQVIIRTYGYIDLTKAYDFKWWHAVFPPYWFAAPFELVMQHNYSPQLIMLSLFSIVFTILVISVHYLLFPRFETNLEKLLESAGRKTKRQPFWEKIWKRMLCRTVETRSYFQFVYRVAQRERAFKLKVYPILGMGLVLPFIFPFSKIYAASLEDLAGGRLYFYIYLLHLFIGIALYTFQFSSSFKGAWIFNLSGRNNRTALYEAVMKVFLVKLYLPLFLLAGTGYYLLFPQLKLMDLLIVFVSAVLQSLLSYHFMMKKDYPFSSSFEEAAEGIHTLKAILLVLLAFPFAGMHLLFSFVPFGLSIYFVCLAVAALFMWQIIFKHPNRIIRL